MFARHRDPKGAGYKIMKNERAHQTFLQDPLMKASQTSQLPLLLLPSADYEIFSEPDRTETSTENDAYSVTASS